jgi:microcystin-dependent protein
MDTYMGTIMLFAFSYAPDDEQGWTTCEGQILTITQYQALYSIIGTVYGGDGVKTFALPNLRGAEPLPNMKFYIATKGLYPPRP